MSSMPEAISSVTWPREHWGEALAQLDEASGNAQVFAAGSSPENARALDDWVHRLAVAYGMHCDPVIVSYRALEQRISTTAPALWKVPGGGALLAVRADAGQVWVLTPDLQWQQFAATVVRKAVCAGVEQAIEAEFLSFERMLHLQPDRRARFRDAVVQDHLADRMFRAGWELRADPSRSFLWQLWRSGSLHQGAALLGLHALQYVLWLLAWFMVGHAALSGRFEPGWLVAWALALLTVVPVRMARRWKEAVLGLRVGRILKERLLVGALRLDLETGRTQGSGQLLGRVLESNAVESLALSGGVSAITAGLEVVVALFVVGLGAGGFAHVMSLVAWVAAALTLAWRYWRRHREWTRRRLLMTCSLTEKMLGHRTRMVQEPARFWHQDEDKELSEYLQFSQRVDHDVARLAVLVPRGWTMISIAVLIPFLVLGAPVTELAVSIGGILLARQALVGFGIGITSLANAAIAWEQVRDLFDAAKRAPVVGDPKYGPRRSSTRSHQGSPPDGAVLLQARGVTLTYPGRREPALAEADLVVRRGDRILLEGSSGGGKSTLAAVLLGLRTPDKGSVLVNGLDRQTLGDHQWHRLVGAAPQFHENHVFTGSFAYNVLMDRWPTSARDLADAERVCRELGLGHLIDRMPAGMLQVVGETGWQLSHGERSRMYIARALLQHADVIVLDESLAALDPHNLRCALECAFRRAPSLLVIAHP